MCGRYTVEEDESVDLRKLYRDIRLTHPHILLKSGEIFPSDTVPLLCGAKGGQNTLPAPAIWGFPGYKGKQLIINARAETASEKPSFRDSFLMGRCAIPTCGYYEWAADKTKYRFNLPEQKILYLAGLCRLYPEGLRFVVLTTEAVPSVRPVHHRMPLLLDETALADWILKTNFARQHLTAPMPALCGRVV